MPLFHKIILAGENHNLPCPRIKRAFAARGIISWILSLANIAWVTADETNALEWPQQKVRGGRRNKLGSQLEAKRKNFI